MANKFSFDNAAFHFGRTEGPSGFLPRYLLAYACGIVVLAVISYFVLRPLIDVYLEAFSMMARGASEAAVERQLTEGLLGNFSQIGLGYLLMLILYAGFWSMMEAAVLRRYVRDEGFSIGWGADEWRVLAVGLIWFAFFIAAYIVFFLAMLGLIMPIGAMMQDSPGLIAIWGGIVMIGLLICLAVAAIKLSPAAALTIRDSKVTFTSAWGATNGRFWPMLGAFLVLGIILYIGVLVIYFVGAFVVFGAAIGGMDLSGPEPDPDQVMALFASPAVLVPIVVFYMAMLIYQGFWQYAWAGIPALAAKTDPRTGGMHNAADAF